MSRPSPVRSTKRRVHRYHSRHTHSHPHAPIERFNNFGPVVLNHLCLPGRHLHLDGRRRRQIEAAYGLTRLTTNDVWILILSLAEPTPLSVSMVALSQSGLPSKVHRTRRTAVRIDCSARSRPSQKQDRASFPLAHCHTNGSNTDFAGITLRYFAGVIDLQINTFNKRLHINIDQLSLRRTYKALGLRKFIDIYRLRHRNNAQRDPTEVGIVLAEITD